MDIHDKMVKELFDTKSVTALAFLIDSGRELEFKYEDKTCFISRDNSAGSVSVWVEKEEQAFDSVEELMDKAEIGSVPLKNIWQECEWGILY